MGNIFQEIGEFFRDDFKAGVRAATDVQPVYLDPDDYRSDDPDANMQAMLDDLERQIPGFDRDEFEQMLQSRGATLEALLGASVNSGPFAGKIIYNGEEYGLVNQPIREIDPERGNAYALAAALSGLDEETIRAMDLDGDDLARFVGYHEGVHLNEPINDSQTLLDTLAREARADHGGIQHLRERGDHELAQAIHDWRALAVYNAYMEFTGSHADPEHATSGLIDGETPTVPTALHEAAINSTFNAVNQMVANELGITVDEAKDLLDNDPEAFIDALDNAVENVPEEIRNSPNASPFFDYIEDFAGAYRRQIIDRGLTSSFNEVSPDSSITLPPLDLEHDHGHDGVSNMFNLMANCNMDDLIVNMGLTADIRQGITSALHGMDAPPEIAGNAELAALAAEQAGLAADIVASMRPDIPTDTPLITNTGPNLQTAAP